MRKISFILLSSSLISSAYALEPMPQESGLSGYVNMGVGVASVESNTLAETFFGIVDLGDDNLDNIYDSPDSETHPTPMLAYELAYTFSSTRTQLYVGNNLEDYIRFDFASRLGVRQEIGNAGLLALSLLQTPVATKVWSDPYVANTPRDSTDRTADGYRLTWDKIFGSELQLRYSARKVDIDKERSGQGLGLSLEDQALLNRNGDSNAFSADYTFRWKDNTHILTPGIEYYKLDADGDAMAYDSVIYSVNYIYSIKQWKYIINGSYATENYDEANPIYGRKADSDHYGATITVFYEDIFGWENWHLNGGIAWTDEDSDIDFYDTSVMIASAGILFRF